MQFLAAPVSMRVLQLTPAIVTEKVAPLVRVRVMTSINSPLFLSLISWVRCTSG